MIHARYLLETPLDPESVAAMMAGEQSAGTFVRVPGETDELRERHGARVQRLTVLGSLIARHWPVPTWSARESRDPGDVPRSRLLIPKTMWA
ncbi:hypothetical protein A8U91_02249 [Halomonas elongata]|uniref:Uncharacterized protein n=1 Tax=Halomonas elongata TaxID=2746 RepID=A0A1B8P6L6_HALEL|nr:hypothetical protein [Halomonas elongata]OBX37870.1 hypothetical protein A8U91_02249 [Halomonas elongata]